MQINRIPLLLQMLEKQPGDPFLLYAVAFEYESAGQEGQALEYYRNILEQHPSYLPVYYQYGLMLSRLGRHEDALEILEKGIQLAMAQKEQKTLRELREALQQVEDEME